MPLSRHKGLAKAQWAYPRIGQLEPVEVGLVGRNDEHNGAQAHTRLEVELDVEVRIVGDRLRARKIVINDLWAASPR